MYLHSIVRASERHNEGGHWGKCLSTWTTEWPTPCLSLEERGKKPRSCQSSCQDPRALKLSRPLYTNNISQILTDCTNTQTPSDVNIFCKRGWINSAKASLVGLPGAHTGVVAPPGSAWYTAARSHTVRPGSQSILLQKVAWKICFVLCRTQGDNFV